jgi:DUF4097 and DUF4098 domain-containing protein YvlB
MTGIALAVSVLAACEVNLNTEGLTVREKRTFPVTGQPEVTLETFDGAIEIHSWDRNEVEVEIEKRGMEQSVLDQIAIEQEHEGDRVVLRVKGPASSQERRITVGVSISPAARLLVAVPRKSLVNARTGDGSIRVENIEGRVVLRTADGSLAVERITGDVEARTGDGSIRVEDGEGRLDVETDDGSITIEARPTFVRARTGDGSIVLRLDAGTAVVEPWDVSTGDGSVTLTLPQSFHAEIDAETRDGSIRSSYPGLEAVAEGEGRERLRQLRTSVGEGGPLLKVRTGDGTIRFER